jgi:hypothetical protein
MRNGRQSLQQGAERKTTQRKKKKKKKGEETPTTGKYLGHGTQYIYQ